MNYLAIFAAAAVVIGGIVIAGRRASRKPHNGCAWAEQMERDLDDMHCHCGQAPSVYLHGKCKGMRVVTKFGKN